MHEPVGSRADEAEKDRQKNQTVAQAHHSSCEELLEEHLKYL